MLEQMELQISNAKEEAFSRKDVLERLEKWKAACEEECWLEEYSRVSVALATLLISLISLFCLHFCSSHC